MRYKRASRLNKTKKLEIPVTEAQHKSVVEHAHQLGIKHTEWARSVILDAVMGRCLHTNQQHEEGTNAQA